MYRRKQDYINPSTSTQIFKGTNGTNQNKMVHVRVIILTTSEKNTINKLNLNVFNC